MAMLSPWGWLQAGLRMLLLWAAVRECWQLLMRLQLQSRAARTWWQQW
jgi:hypothetical protein